MLKNALFNSPFSNKILGKTTSPPPLAKSGCYAPTYRICEFRSCLMEWHLMVRFLHSLPGFLEFSRNTSRKFQISGSANQLHSYENKSPCYLDSYTIFCHCSQFVTLFILQFKKNKRWSFYIIHFTVWIIAMLFRGHWGLF